MASPSTAHIPVLCLSHSGSTLGGTDGHGAFVYTFGSDQPPRRVGAPRDASGQGELKSELVRLVAVREATEGDGKGASKTGIVTTVSEDKHISTFEAESGRLLYQRTAIKKINVLSIEADNQAIVSDKVGDVFSYPCVDDSKVDPFAPVKPRPDATALLGDPSLNPDADLLLGHVSVVTAHLLTPDGKEMITADRDEHIRISRYPECHVIERFLFGHEDFVSALCIPPSQPALLLSAGGDPSILFHTLTSPHPLYRLSISHAIAPYRAVRPLMRRLRRRKDGSVPQRETSGVGAATARLSEMRVRGPPYTAEEMGLVPEGFGLPVGEGVCVSRMEAVGEDIVFFSEGCTAIHAFRLPHDMSEGAPPPTIRAYDFKVPVLTFTALALEQAPGRARSVVFVSIDTLWRDRVDGGRAFEVPVDAGAAAKARKGGGEGADQGGVEAVKAAQQAETLANEPDLRVVEVSESGEVSDVTSEFPALNAWRRDQAETADLSAILAVPLYANLTVLPKWHGEDDDGGDDVDDAAALDGLGKRALGQLRAKGVDVDAKMSAWQRERTAAAKQAGKTGGKGKKRKVEKEDRGEQVGAKGDGDVDMEEMMNA